jgi:hypothetical protein
MAFHSISELERIYYSIMLLGLLNGKSGIVIHELEGVVERYVFSEIGTHTLLEIYDVYSTDMTSGFSRINESWMTKERFRMRDRVHIKAMFIGYIQNMDPILFTPFGGFLLSDMVASEVRIFRSSPVEFYAFEHVVTGCQIPPVRWLFMVTVMLNGLSY